MIFEVAPAGPDTSILDVFKGASEHNGNGGCGIGDGNSDRNGNVDGDGDGNGGGGRCVPVMSVSE